MRYDSGNLVPTEEWVKGMVLLALKQSDKNKKLRTALADLIYQYDERGFVHESQLAQARELLEETK